MKQTIDELMLKGNYDSKHINNLSNRHVPSELLKALESGCSYETLQELAKGFPVCRYETQITIHGIFDAPSTRYVGDYCNLFQNKNKSLGVRWTAIDHEKKSRLLCLIHATDKAWQKDSDSTGFRFAKARRADSREKALEYLNEYKRQAQQINRALFTGNVFAEAFCTWGVYYIILHLDIKCFPQRNFYALAENITGVGRDELESNYKSYMQEQERKEQERRAELDRWTAEYNRQQEEERARREEAVKTFRENNPIPSVFEEVTDYKPQVNDIVLCLDSRDLNNIKYSYKVVGKSFGRLTLYTCDINGVRDRTAKGSALLRTVYPKKYVKRA